MKEKVVRHTMDDWETSSDDSNNSDNCDEE